MSIPTNGRSTRIFPILLAILLPILFAITFTLTPTTTAESPHHLPIIPLKPAVLDTAAPAQFSENPYIDRLLFGTGQDAATAMALGDMNDDGLLDVVIANADGTDRQNVVYLDGGFTGETECSAPELSCFGNSTDQTRDLALGDMDNDGDLDVVTVNDGAANNIYINGGDGQFVGSSTFGSPTQATTAVALADFNADGLLDIAVGTTYEQNAVYLNKGNGRFDTGTICGRFILCYGGGSHQTNRLAAGDLNDDGYPDLVSANEIDSYIYFNNGGNGFDNSILSTCVTSSQIHCINVNAALPQATKDSAVGDMNGDGHLDVLVAESGGSQIGVFLNDGSGGFPTVPSAVVGNNRDNKALALGDLDYDGDVDIVVGRTNAPNVIFINDGSGTSFAPFNSGAVVDTNSTAVGDLDGDNVLDIVFGNDLKINIIYLGSGAPMYGRHSQPIARVNGTTTETFYTKDVAYGDMNNDGHVDIVAVNRNAPAGQANQVYYNDGTGHFPATDAYVHTFGNDDSTAVAVADFDADGHLDIAVANNSGSGQANVIYYNNGLGRFDVYSGTFGTGSDRTNDLAVADFDGDSYLDIVVANFGVTNVVYYNDGYGLFPDTPLYRTELPTAPGSDNRSLSVAAGDLDRDSAPDIVIGNTTAGGEDIVYMNNGNGFFAYENATFYDTGSYNTYDLALADMNGDGLQDIIAGNRGGQSKVHLNDGLGGFPTDQQRQFGDVSEDLLGLAVGDVDGDLLADIVVANVNTPNYIFINQFDGEEFFQAGEFGQPVPTNDIALADVDRDGDLDVAAANGSNANSEANQLFLNGLVSSPANRTNTLPYVSISRPLGTGPDAPGQASATILSQRIISIPFTLYDNDGDSVGYLSTLFSPDGGGSWLPITPSDDLPHRNLATRAIRSYANHNQLSLTDGENTTSTLTVDVLGQIVDVDVWLALEHDKLDQVRAHLLDPAGNSTQLFKELGTAGDGLEHIILDDEAVQAVTDSISAPFTGRYRPLQPLDISDGEEAGGEWRLVIEDGEEVEDGEEEEGTIKRWGITLTIAAPINYSSVDVPQAIVDQDVAVSTLSIDEAHTIDDLDVWVMIDHSFTGDLVGTLVGPDGTIVDLFTNVGAGGDNFDYTIFNDEATDTLSSSIAPFRGQYQPEGSLADFDGRSMEGQWELKVEDDATGDTGSLRAWGLRAQVGDGSYVYQWDTFQNGLFGQSDEIVVRMEAFGVHGRPQPGTIPSPATRTYNPAVTNEFRARGTTVRVVNESGQPVEEAIVYAIPDGATFGDTLGDDLGAYTTDADGYLRGRGEIAAGDQLVALLPVTASDYITFTDAFSMYFTSAAPITDGLDAHVVQQQGVQTLTVSQSSPLLFLNLDVSLEWDSRSDTAYLEQLEDNLYRTAEILYDLTDGQVTLGDVNVYQDDQNVEEAEIIVYASNAIRPNANLGGVVTTAVTDTISSTRVITDAYLPGQIRMGATWNRFGNASGDLGEDWPRALAHEIGHYALFMLDQYLGISPQTGLLTPTECQGTAMSDAYVYSEFLTAADWTGDCLITLQEQQMGRNDWEAIQTFYPFLTSNNNAGPSNLPLNITAVNFQPVGQPVQAIEAPFFTLVDDSGGTLYLGRQASAYLQKNFYNADETDDKLVPVGSPNRSTIHARGAEPGDRLCLFDYSVTTADVRAGCMPITADPSPLLSLSEIQNWSPDVDVTPVNSRTLLVTATLQTAETGLLVQVLPSNGQASAVAPMVDTNGGTIFTRTVDLDETLLAGHVRVFKPDYSKESYSKYAINIAWYVNNRGWYVNNRGWYVNNRGWYVNNRGWYAPVSSSDGQVTIFNLDNVLGNIGNYTLETTNQTPLIPVWLTMVGNAYELNRLDNTDSRNSITFGYLERDIPDGYEYALTVYYSPDEGTTWQRLPTEKDQDLNWAAAEVQGSGLYILAATIELPSFDVGWNTFGYPVPETRTVTESLASIAGNFTSVYGYDSNQSPPWLLYDATVTPPFSSTINNLTHFEFGEGYWLHATSTVTAYLNVPQTNSTSSTSYETPPATYYGWITPSAEFTPTVNMPITVTVNGNVCGQSKVINLNSQFAYKIQVTSDNIFADNGCGIEAISIVNFQVGSWIMNHPITWSNIQANLHSLSMVQAPPLSPNEASVTITDSIKISWSAVTKTENGNATTIDYYEVWQSNYAYSNPLTNGTKLTETSELFTIISDSTPGGKFYAIYSVDVYGQRSKLPKKISIFTFGISPGD